MTNWTPKFYKTAHGDFIQDTPDGPLKKLEGSLHGAITSVDRPAQIPAMAAKSTLDATLTERGSRYGKFVDHARYSQLMKDAFVAYMGPQKYDSLQPDQKEALAMIFHKLARIANGDPDYADSWVDIAGYAKLVADRLEGVER